MATATDSISGTAIDQIGETAGLVWQALHQGGRMSFTKLYKEVEAPRDLVLQAVGWLAREDKIEIDDQARTKMISLR
ncbi:MAG: hypothetical protein DCC68_19220 [Planctomycetota bacterium]|nr:MAG: hypothetical protein DCC68_19220 [Planctomycetota bacterium]